MLKKVLVEVGIDEGRWDPTWDDGDRDESVREAVQTYIEHCPEWPPYFAYVRAVGRPVNVYKIVFLGAEVSPEFKDGRTLIGSNAVLYQKYIYQTYIFEETGELAIKTVKEMAKKNEIEIEDFTEVSLTVSTQAFGVFMKEKL